MKFEDIKEGMKIQHKETGVVYTVTDLRTESAYLDDTWRFCDFYNHKMNMIGRFDAKLFRKYKGD